MDQPPPALNSVVRANTKVAQTFRDPLRAGDKMSSPSWQYADFEIRHLATCKATLKVSLKLAFDGESDFERHLPVLHFSLFDIAARFNDLKPRQVLDGFVRALNGVANGLFDGNGGSASKFDEFIDVVFHVRFFILGLSCH